jgi:dephospho-CoA kinase
VLTVALTGGIATGKSIVAARLEQRGCYIHSADQTARDLMQPGRRAWKEAVSHFGRGVLNPDRTINRAKLGAIIFRDAQERLWLNALIHPRVLARKKRVIHRLEKEGKYRIYVSEAALTIESGFAPFFDRVVVVHCARNIQIRRLMARDAIDRRAALARIRSQMSSPEKQSLADYLIDTSGSLENTLRQTDAVYRCLLGDYRGKRTRERKAAARPARPGAKPPGAGS